MRVRKTWKISIRNDLESTAQSDATSNWEYDLIQEVLNGSEFQIEESDKDLYVDQMMSEYESYAAAAQYGTGRLPEHISWNHRGTA